MDDCKQLALLAHNNPGRNPLFVGGENVSMSVAAGQLPVVEYRLNQNVNATYLRCRLVAPDA